MGGKRGNKMGWGGGSGRGYIGCAAESTGPAVRIRAAIVFWSVGSERVA